MLLPALIISAGIWSIPGDLWLFSFSIVSSTSKALGSGTSGCAVCISRLLLYTSKNYSRKFQLWRCKSIGIDQYLQNYFNEVVEQFALISINLISLFGMKNCLSGGRSQWLYLFIRRVVKQTSNDWSYITVMNCIQDSIHHYTVMVSCIGGQNYLTL